MIAPVAGKLDMFLADNDFLGFTGLATLRSASAEGHRRFAGMLTEEQFRFDQYPGIAMILRAICMESRGLDREGKIAAARRFRFAVTSQPHLHAKEISLDELDEALNGVVVGPEPSYYQESSREDPRCSLRVWPEVRTRSVTLDASQRLFDIFNMSDPACIYSHRSLLTRFRDSSGEWIERPTGILSVRGRNFEPEAELEALRCGSVQTPRYGFIHPLCSWSVWAFATPPGKEVDPSEFPRLSGLRTREGDIWVVLEFTAATVTSTPMELLEAVAFENNTEEE